MKVALIAIAALALAGCSKEGNKAKNSALEVTSIGGTGEQFAEPKKGDTIAEIVVKDFGSMKFKFFKDEAPKAVENFVTHSKDGYYDGLAFHRIIDDFMIQGGDPEGTGAGGESIWGKDFEDECVDTLQPFRGALCMANSGAGTGTNGSQFFVVQAKPLTDEWIKMVEEQNDIELPTDPVERLKTIYGTTFKEDVAANYDKVGGTPWLAGAHTVFGQMLSGYDVLDKIAATAVEGESPESKVIIEKIIISEY